MLQSLGHLLVAGVLAIFTVLALQAWRSAHRSYSLIVVLVGAGLVYDNAVLGIGRWIGHGEALELLSVPRFALHAFGTPLLIIVGFGALRAFGVAWAQRRGTHAVACIVATAFVAWGVVVDLVRLELVEQRDAGVVSYGNDAASAPVPAIVTIIALVAAGVVLWRAAAWPWLALGAAVMFVASALGSISGLLTNLGELSLIGSLVATERRAGRLMHRGPTESPSATPTRSLAAGGFRSSSARSG